MLKVVAVSDNRNFNGFNFDHSPLKTIAQIQWVNHPDEIENCVTTKTTVAIIIDEKVAGRSGYSIAQELRQNIGLDIALVVFVNGHGMRREIPGNTTMISSPFDENGLETYVLALLEQFKLVGNKPLDFKTYLRYIPYFTMILNSQYRVLAENNSYFGFPAPSDGVYPECFTTVHGSVVPHKDCPLMKSLKTRKMVEKTIGHEIIGKFRISVSPIKFPGQKETLYLHIAHAAN